MWRGRGVISQAPAQLHQWPHSPPSAGSGHNWREFHVSLRHTEDKNSTSILSNMCTNIIFLPKKSHFLHKLLTFDNDKCPLASNVQCPPIFKRRYLKLPCCCCLCTVHVSFLKISSLPRKSPDFQQERRETQYPPMSPLPASAGRSAAPSVLPSFC